MNLLRRCAVVSMMALVLCGGTVAFAQYNIQEVSIPGIPAAAAGVTFVMSGALSGGFSSTTNELCFYQANANGATATPLLPTSLAKSYSVTIPASYIQAVPPSAFGPASGYAPAELYVVPAGGTCNGTTDPALTNTFALNIYDPQVNSVTTSILPLPNPNAGSSQPVQFTVSGAYFTPLTVVDFQGLSGGTLTATTKYIGPGALLVTMPAIPAATTTASTATLQVRTAGPLGNYNALNTATEGFYALLQSQLTAPVLTPNPPTAGFGFTSSTTASLLASAANGPQLGGVPSGSVSFSAGSNTYATAALQLNPLTASFSLPPPPTLTPYTGVSGSAIVDLNGDGIPDAVSVAPTGNGYTAFVNLASYPRGQLGPTLQTALDSSCTQLTSIAVADINGDGIPDLIADCLNGGNGVIDVYPGFGDGTFDNVNFAVPIGGVYGTQVLAGPFFHDGLNDILVAGITGVGSAPPFGIAAWQNQGNYTFANPVITTFTDGGLRTFHVVAADFNGDGYPDLVAYSATELALFLNRKDGTFGDGTGNETLLINTFAADFTINSVAVADLNKDGKPDIAAILQDEANDTNQGIYAFLNTTVAATESFAAPVFSYFGAPTALAIADFDGDGFLDAAVSTYDLIAVLSGDGTGAFSQQDPDFVHGAFFSNNPANIVELAAYDLNGDGLPDVIAVTGEENNSGPLTLITTGNSTASKLANPNLPIGTYTITDSYNGDQNFAKSTNTASIGVSGEQTVTALTVSNASIVYGTSETFTGQVTPFLSGGVAPSATIGFYDGTKLLGSVAVNAQGIASYSTTNLGAGSHSLTAVYAGDTYNLTSTSLVKTVVVTPASLTATANNLSKEQGQPNPTLTYAITGFVNGDTQSSATTGQPSLSTTATTSSPAGTYPITITAGSLAAANYTFTFVNGVLTVSEGLELTSIKPNSGFVDDPATTITVTGAAFVSGDAVTVNGTAVTTTFVSSTELTAVIPASDLVAAGTLEVAVKGSTAASNSVAFTVAKITTTTALAASPANPTYGQTETLKATVTPVKDNAASVAKVTFYDGTKVLGTANLGTNFTASLSLVLGAGAHALSAVYAGDTVYVASTSPTNNLTVTAAVLTVTANDITKEQGQPNPTLTYMMTGFVNGDTQESATTGQPSLTTTATTNSPAGTYPITVTKGTLAATDYTFKFVNGVLTVGQLSLTSIAPNSADIGASATTITLTGVGFEASCTAEVNAKAVSTTFVSNTTLKAVIPAADLANPATLEISVMDTKTAQATSSLPFAVVIPPVNISFSGPPSGQSDEQSSLTFQLINPYPAPLVVKLSLVFTPNPEAGVVDPTVQFATGGTTYTFTIPANSTATPDIALQTGTTAGTITVSLGLTTDGVDVTPAGLQPVVIDIAEAVPTLSSVVLTQQGDTVNVVIEGFSNTREASTATFSFTADGTITNPVVPVTATPLFATWYASTASDAYGTAFTYQQSFTLNGPTLTITGVSVTLANTVGTSSAEASQ